MRKGQQQKQIKKFIQRVKRQQQLTDEGGESIIFEENAGTTYKLILTSSLDAQVVEAPSCPGYPLLSLTLKA